MVQDLVAYARERFGWDGDVVATAGPRGALGQIWRIDVGSARYALKEIFADPASEAAIDAELAFARRAAGAGVLLPASHRDRDGRYLITTPGGAWLRVYDWVELRPVDLTAPRSPRDLGELLARLHRCAPSAADEPLDPWYEQLPALDAWSPAAASDAPWASRLADRLAVLPDLYAAAIPADPARLIVCHRDLHPENVLTDPSGALVVVDWDNLGPADPGQELARALFDWFCDGTADLHAMGSMLDAYADGGGPGRITTLGDFTMLIATRLNFLLLQAGIALDPRTEDQHRAWAEREIDEALRIIPTPRQLDEVMNLVR